MSQRDIRRQLSAPRAHRAGAPTSINRRVVLAVAVILGLLLALAGFGWWSAMGERNKAREDLSRALNPPCIDGAEVLAAVAEDRQAGRLELAVDRAETALNNPREPWCAEPRRRLVKSWYTTSVALVLRAPSTSWFDPQEQLAAVRRWQDVSAAATKYGVDDLDTLAPADLFRRAHENRLWELADWAYRQADTNGTADSIPPAARIEFLVDWGVAMSDSPVVPSVEHSLVVLRTAVAVGDAYGLDVREPCRYLSQELLSGGDCRGIAPDSSEPLLEDTDG